jgi:SAM-dependent methyltransferase
VVITTFDATRLIHGGQIPSSSVRSTLRHVSQPLPESMEGLSPLEFAVLRRRSEIDAAMRELARRELLPHGPGVVQRVVSRFGKVIGRPSPSVELFPDPTKSWDVLRSIEAISSSVEREAPVLDVGSVASAVLPCLHALGYRSLMGIDLDVRVESMPLADGIEYAVEDLTRTSRPDRSFAAITAISVIEHGVDDEPLLSEIARLLRPGGIFVFSTDYWPEKVDTEGISLFGLPWRIFSASEIEEFLDRADRFGLVPASDPLTSLRSVEEPVIRFHGRSYTFLYGVLVRG